MSDASSPQDAGPPATILFVEDEALIRMDMAEFLRECGYRVHEASDASEALEALQAKFAIDLVFTDVNFPRGMTGVELADWVLTNRAGAKVIVTTGRGVPTALAPKVGKMLPKPYTGRDLHARVRQALSSPQEAPGDGGIPPSG